VVTSRRAWIKSLAPALAAAASLARALPLLAERPGFELGAERMLVMATIPDVLSKAEVKPRLNSGLTTSFVFDVTATDGGGRTLKGGGLVEIRYELWDEVYLVAVAGADGRQRRDSLPSLDRLLAWWRGLKLPVLNAGDRLAAGKWHLDVDLSVIPFSRAEQSETQSWLSRSLTEERAGPTPPGETAPPAAAAAVPVSGVLDMLVSTSIKRRSVVSFEWRSELQVGPAGPAGSGVERRQ
jgi:hypothetical protein